MNQEYQTRALVTDVILGNDALMKCEIPSFVSDFVSVNAWSDNEGNEFLTNARYGNFRNMVILKI